MNKNEEGLFDVPAENDNTNPAEGVDELVNMPKELKDVEGNSFAIPMPNWGMELQVIVAVGKLLKDVKDEIDVPLSEIAELSKSENKIQLNTIIYTMMEKAPDEVTKIVAKIVGKDKKFVEEKLDIAHIMEILVPFFVSRMTHLTKSMNRMDANFGQLMQGLSGSPLVKQRKKKSH